MVFWLSIVFLFFLPFLDGGTNFLAEVLLLTLPLPLFLIGISGNEFNFANLRPAIIFSWLVFLAFIFMSVLTSTSLIFSLPAFFQTLAVFLWFCLFLLTAGKEKFNTSFGLVMVVGFSLSLVSFYYLLPGAARPPAGMNLVYASYGHNHLADVLLLSIPLALALFLTGQKRRNVLLLGLLILLYMVALILTFSRGAFVVLPPVMALLFFWIRPKLISQKFLSWLLVLLPVGLIFIIGFFSLSQTGLEAKLAQPQNWLVKQLVKPEFQAKRIEYWQQALEGFVTKPLTGFGWGTFELVALRFQRTTAGWSNYTHNFYFQVLAEAGIFAFLSFLSFLGVVFYELWRLLKRNRGNPLILGGSAAILASSLHSFLDFDWHFPAVFLLFLLIIASLIGKTKGEQGARTPPWRYGLLFLALIVFLFGQLEVLSEYFEQKHDFKRALLLAPWPAARVRDVGTRVLLNEPEGEKFMNNLAWVFGADSGMALWLGDKNYENGDLAKAAENYRQAIEANPLGNPRLYAKLGQIYAGKGQSQAKDNLYQSFAQNLARVKSVKENNSLAKTLYQIGGEYLKEGQSRKALFWWEEAAVWAPRWSYFYIEAAALKLKLGDREGAKTILAKCQTYDSPRAYCQNYTNRLVGGKGFEAPGFLEEQIKLVPDY